MTLPGYDLPPFEPVPLTLVGEHVRLEPLERRHADDLFVAAAGDVEIWRYMPIDGFRRVADTLEWIDAAAQRARAGEVPFAIIDAGTGRAVGSTRYLDIRREHRGLEIGYTWISAEFQRTAVNTECKLLLLAQAFDALGAIRVQLKTDSRNVRSRRAIERIGATFEGILRSHMICWDGSLRDSAFYSITRPEWPSVQDRLRSRLRGGRAGT